MYQRDKKRLVSYNDKYIYKHFYSTCCFQRRCNTQQTAGREIGVRHVTHSNRVNHWGVEFL